MGRLELVALIFRGRLERLDIAKVGAKHIGRVRHAHLPGKDIEYPGTWHRPGDIRRKLLSGRIEAGIDAGKMDTALSGGAPGRSNSGPTAQPDISIAENSIRCDGPTLRARNPPATSRRECGETL